MSMAAGDFRPARLCIAHPHAGCQTPGADHAERRGRVRWLVVPNSVSTAARGALACTADPPVSCYRASGTSMSRGGGQNREVPVPGVVLKLRARYRLGVEPGMPGWDCRVRIPVVDRCRHRDGPELETPGPREHPQVLGNSPAAAAESLGITDQECVAHAGLGDRAAVDAGQFAGGKAEEQPW
jgi:hypothetical protein